MYVWFAHLFLEQRFAGRRLAPRKLRASDVWRFVAKQAGSTGPMRAQLMVTALRSFFRFLVREGETDIDLAAAVPSVRCREQNAVPKYLNDEDVERLLKSCDRSGSAGRRDYAALVLLARLGLRAAEVAGLKLDDIDWRSGEIRVLGKGQVRDRVPLLPEVGEALVEYLRHDRRRVPCREVILRLKAPLRGFGSSAAVSTLVRRALARAKLKPPHQGAHLLRHSLATKLLRRGASMAEIAEVLRHRSPGTTEICAKVDSSSLGALAQPWPGPKETS
jgi:site-specific recombinase XerD